MSVHQLHDEDWEPFLTKRQVAERLGFSVRWVELKTATAGLPSHLIGGQRRFLWSQVQAWVQDRTQVES